MVWPQIRFLEKSGGKTLWYPDALIHGIDTKCHPDWTVASQDGEHLEASKLLCSKLNSSVEWEKISSIGHFFSNNEDWAF